MARSPGAWLALLEAGLTERWKRIAVYDAYYEGDHRLNFASKKFREAFGSLFQTIADNWMPIVVDAPVERLEVQGLRFGKQQEADDAAWDIWQANGLDAESDLVHTEAGKLCEAYWLVQPPKGDEAPRITSEHPSQMIVATAPGDRRQRLAALKKWASDDGFAYANLYLEDRVVKWRSKFELAKGGATGGQINWVQIEDTRHRLEVVPVIPVCNNPSMLRGGSSDLAGGAIDLQDAINKLLSDMLIGSEYQAFPQRVLMGVEVPTDENGVPTRAAELQASQSRNWYFENQDAKAFEFSAADLKNYIEASKHLVSHLTAQTRTPPHYVLGDIVNVSAEALTAAEAGLVAKTRKKMRPFGEAHEEALRLAFKALRDEEKANATDAEVIWRSPEYRSEAQVVDAAVKLATIGVPNEVLWERVGFSPQEIGRMRAMQESDQFLTVTADTQQAALQAEAARKAATVPPMAPPNAPQ